MSGSSVLDFNFGQAGVVGGARNDLLIVGGDLTLDGTLNVTVTPGGAFDPGVYRIISYGGMLTDNILDIGVIPSPDLYLQTSIAQQVNLVNKAGLTLNFWDGAAGSKNDGSVNGGDGVWQNLVNDNWTDSNGVANAPFSDRAFAIFAGLPGTVTVDNLPGAVNAAGMQFMVDGYQLKGNAVTLVGGPSSIIRVGDGTLAGADWTATIDAELAGATELVKSDLGTLVLNATNSYTGGTAINGGVLQVSANTNLGAAVGDVNFDGGTLRTTTSFTTDRNIKLAGAGGLSTDADTTLALTGTTTGAGSLTKLGGGTLALNGAASHTGTTTVAAGRLLAGGSNLLSASSNHTVLAGATLDLAGSNQTIAGLNQAGIVRLNGGGGSTLTVTGDYVGNNGLLLLDSVLNGDASATDRLVVGGNTSGAATLAVANFGGTGAPTPEGIKIVDVAGKSDGQFKLAGDYVFEGEQAVVSGAYAYRLYQNGVATPADGNWYLRSALRDPVVPLFQPG